jgi:hypothetical protein
MPSAPYPISGTVYDRDGSTAVAAIVTILDTATHEKTSITCNSNGQFIIDAANLASGYTNGDHLQITASYGSGSGIRSLSKRHTIDTGTGSYDCGSIVLHSGEDSFLTCNITFASHTNSHSGNLYVDFYDRTNDNLVFRIETIAGETEALPIGYLGVKMDGGFIRIFESETSGRSEVLTVFK